MVKIRKCVMNIFFLFLFASSLFAKGAVKELKVCFYPLDGFFGYDENGKEVGYGVDVLNKISEYSNIKFKYIKIEQWEECGKLIRNGTADIAMPVSKPSTTSDEIAFTDIGIINTYYSLMTLKTRDDLYYEDYEKIAKLKIAISESLYNKNDLHDYISSYRILKNNLVFCKSYDECLDKLLSGDVDALVSNVMDFNPETMKMIERFHTVSNYIGAKINNPAIYEINEALVKINLNYPSFFSDLYKIYYPERAEIPMSLTEVKYLKNLSSICIPCVDGQGYLCRKEKGEYVGIFPAFSSLVCNKLGVNFRPIDMENKKVGDEAFLNHGAKVIAGHVYNKEFAAKNNLTLSNPFFVSEYSMVFRKNVDINHKTCKVAAIKGFYYVEDYVLKKYDEKQIVWCKNIKESIDAVVSKKADITILNNYIAEYYLSIFRYSCLMQRLINYSHQMCFAVADDPDGVLVSCINKVVASVPQQNINKLVLEQTAMIPDQNLFKALIYNNPVEVLFSICAVLILVFLVMYFGYFTHVIKIKNRALRTEVSKVEKATKAKTEFLSRMSHDIRTPINTITGLTALAMDEDISPSTKRYLSDISSSSNFLLGLINDVLDMDKISSGKLTLKPERYVYDDFIAVMETMFLPLCKKKNINFIYDKGKTDEDIFVDKIRFNQIFFNIISNAIKFTPNGGTVSYKVFNSVIDGDILHCDFSVADTGCGMSEQFMKHMYDAFSQENQKHVSVSEGSGLGLSIVKQLVDLMNGTISCESKIGEGTAFKIHLDLKIIPKLNESLKKGNSLKQIYDVVLRNKKILLVEDHPMNCEITKILLEKKGMVVFTAKDGKEAVEKFSATDEFFFDAILMDIRMPEMNGFEATKKIRSLGRKDSKRVPIIAMTADAYDDDIKQSLDAGMNDHLSKPIDCEKLYATLADFLLAR